MVNSEAMSGLLWKRITEIAGTDDPNQLTYWTGLGYAQLTRYKNGKSGTVRGPAAADLQTMAETLSLRTGRRITMGQLWGAEELDAAAATSRGGGGDASARPREDLAGVEEAADLVEGAQAPPQSGKGRRAGGQKP